jgi:hypothetical protein
MTINNHPTHHPKFAPVAPIQILEEMSPFVFGDYHLLLAHHVLEFPERFTARFREYILTTAGGDVVVIMDNSIVELGIPIPIDVMEAALKAISTAEPIHAHRLSRLRLVPVLPDEMGSADITALRSTIAYSEWVQSDIVDLSEGFMLVTHGPSWEEFTNIADAFLLDTKAFPLITWAGVPRLLGPMRTAAVQYIHLIRPDINIHLLGFSDNIWDDLQAARQTGVLGIDSAVPIRHPQQLSPSHKQEPRPKNWFEKGTLDDHPHALDNIRAVRQWLSIL